MAKQEFLNFKEISSAIQFSDVLNWLNIAYEKKDKELRGEGFIVSIEKNLFFSPDDESIKGSIINFVSHVKNINARDAASLLKKQFLSKLEAKLKRDIPVLTLQYDEYLEKRGISPEIAKEYEVGIAKEQRSIMSGRIACRVYDYKGNPSGYIGYKVKDESWFFPKGFKRPLYNRERLKDTKSIIVTVDAFDALKIISQTKFNQVTALLANSMTSEQESELKTFRYILLLHPDPTNLIGRLYPSCFIRAPVLSKKISEMSIKELLEIIKPS